MKTINNLENTREPAWRWWCSTHNKRVEVQLLFSADVFCKGMSNPDFTINLTASREHFYCCNGACWIYDY